MLPCILVNKDFHYCWRILLNSHMSCISREIHTRQCYCTVFTAFGCHCHSSVQRRLMLYTCTVTCLLRHRASSVAAYPKYAKELCILWYKHQFWQKCILICCEHFQILGHLKFSLHVRHIGFQNGRHLKIHLRLSLGLMQLLNWSSGYCIHVQKLVRVSQNAHFLNIWAIL